MDMDTIASLLMAGGLASIFLLGSLVGWYAHILHQQDRDMKQCDKDQRAWHAEHRPGVPYDAEDYQAAGVWPDSAISPEAHARIKQNVDDAMQKYDDEVAYKLWSQVFDNDSGQGACI